jgi:hypothetical protein
MRKITIYRVGEKTSNGAAYGAFDEDGNQFDGHYCSSDSWAKFDLITNIGPIRKKGYEELYPEGYEIVNKIDEFKQILSKELK